MHLQAIKKPCERISRKLNRRTLSSEVFPLITVKLGAEALTQEGGLVALLRQLPSWTRARRPPSPLSAAASALRRRGALTPRQPGEPGRARRLEASRLAAIFAAGS